MSTQRPLIGVAVIIKKDNAILLGKRKGSHGQNTWSPPGGHLEFGESLEQCASREVLEETGLIVGDFKRGPYTNDVFTQDNKHYITLYLTARYTLGTPTVLEPDKCECWQWFSWYNLPQPLFLPLTNLLAQVSLHDLKEL